MDVEYFPFDEQTCVMKFGSWTYDGFQVDLRHQEEECTNYKEHEYTEYNPIVSIGVDLSEFYMSVEWDILAVPAVRNEKYYPCCEEPYPDIFFNITMRRKTLFYTVNLIIPCMGISFLTVLVFYLPSDSGEKVSLSISILLSLTVFFLLLAEIIPPTSIAVPLLGKYLLFTMILVTFSVVVTIGVLNVNFRTPATHKMAPWVRKTFVDFLPKYLFIERPKKEEEPGPFDPLPMPSQQSLPTQHEDDDDDVQEEVIENCSQHSSLHKQPCPVTIAASVNSIQLYGDGGTLNHNHLMRPPSQIHQLDGLATLSPLEYSHHYHPYAHQKQLYGGPPPPLPPHHTHGGHGGHHPSHAHAHTHGPLHDENGVIANGPNDESATSDLATSYLAYSDYEARLSKADQIDREINPAIERATNALKFVAQHVKNEDSFNSYADDWKYVAMVLDRILLWMFTIACVVGTGGIIMAAPSHYDARKPIDVLYSKIDLKSDLMTMLKNTGREDYFYIDPR